MLLKANKYRKDKKADCRQNELGSRIFMGRVFVDYAECLHFYPSFSYGRIIAGEKPGQPKLSGQSRENAYLRAMLWRADTSYIRLRMAETSLRLMVLSAWNVPFASEPVRMPAR